MFNCRQFPAKRKCEPWADAWHPNRLMPQFEMHLLCEYISLPPRRTAQPQIIYIGYISRSANIHIILPNGKRVQSLPVPRRNLICLMEKFIRIILIPGHPNTMLYFPISKTSLSKSSFLRHRKHARHIYVVYAKFGNHPVNRGVCYFVWAN